VCNVTLFYRNVSTSTKNIKRLTLEERKAIIIEPETYDKLIGIMLSDGHISLRPKSVNARFHFSQSGKPQKTEYFDFVAHMMKHYCTPTMKPYTKN
jgi:hypothetical protein